MPRSYVDILKNIGSLTTVQRDALILKLPRMVVYNSTVQSFQRYDGSEWENISGPDYNHLLEMDMFDDFVNSIPSGFTNQYAFYATSNTTGTNTISVPADSRLGVIVQSTTTGGTNRALIGSNATQTLIGGVTTIRSSIKIPNLATVAEDFWMRFGLNLGIGQAPTHGIHFEYNRSLSANWRCTTTTASDSTTTDTAIPVTAGEYNFKIKATPTECKFYLNHALVATHVDDIPASTVALQVQSMIQKTNGITARTIEVDYLHYNKILTSPRT